MKGKIFLVQRGWAWQVRQVPILNICLGILPSATWLTFNLGGSGNEVVRKDIFCEQLFTHIWVIPFDM